MLSLVSRCRLHHLHSLQVNANIPHPSLRLCTRMRRPWERGHKAEHCHESIRLGAGLFPAFRLRAMTETQESIHHSDESGRPRGEQLFL